MINSLRLQGFRSYSDSTFEFEPGVNIIVGPNASGKTNIIEGVTFLCSGSSFRAKDTELIKNGVAWARLEGFLGATQRIAKIIPQEYGLVKKEFIINDQKITRLSLHKRLSTVLFEPNHLLLLRGSPENRREYLDNIIEQTVPGYGQSRREYLRNLAQRNALLKTGRPALDTLFAWNIRLSESGAKIAINRSLLVEKLNSKISETYNQIAQSDTKTVTLKYKSSCTIDQYASSLLKALEKRQEIDIERGYTGVGPHREDLLVEIDNQLANDTASRGEIRTIILSLKVLELQLLEESRGVKPLLLLDDVFSELDGARRKALTEVISGYQTFITTTDADVVVHHFMENCNILPL